MLSPTLNVLRLELMPGLTLGVGACVVWLWCLLLPRTGELAAVCEPMEDGEFVMTERGRTIGEVLQASIVSAVFACRSDCVSRSDKGFCCRRFHGSERVSAASSAFAAPDVSRGLSSASTGGGLPRFGFLGWTAKGEGAVSGRVSQLGTSSLSEKGVCGCFLGMAQPLGASQDPPRLKRRTTLFVPSVTSSGVAGLLEVAGTCRNRTA